MTNYEKVQELKETILRATAELDFVLMQRDKPGAAYKKVEKMGELFQRVAEMLKEEKFSPFDALSFFNFAYTVTFSQAMDVWDESIKNPNQH